MYQKLKVLLVNTHFILVIGKWCCLYFHLVCISSSPMIMEVQLPSRDNSYEIHVSSEVRCAVWCPVNQSVIHKQKGFSFWGSNKATGLKFSSLMNELIVLDFWMLSIVWYSGKNTMFQKLDMFLSSDEKVVSWINEWMLIHMQRSLSACALARAHTHTHTHTYIYIYIYICRRFSKPWQLSKVTGYKQGHSGFNSKHGH
jgi:hypothetical protein